MPTKAELEEEVERLKEEVAHLKADYDEVNDQRSSLLKAYKEADEVVRSLKKELQERPAATVDACIALLAKAAQGDRASLNLQRQVRSIQKGFEEKEAREAAIAKRKK